MIHSKKSARTSLLLLPFALLACQGAPAEGGVRHTGSVQMALVSSTNGVSYRLHGAHFAVTGPTSVTLDSDVQPDATRLTTTLSVGNYQVALEGGWDLERLDGGTYEAIQATLISGNPTAFTISDGATTSLIYQFATTGGVITIGAGMLDVGIAVTTSGGSGGNGGSTSSGGSSGAGGGSSGGLLLGPPVSVDSNFKPSINDIPSTFSVAVADINRDGAPDIVAADPNLGGVSVMIKDLNSAGYLPAVGYGAGDIPIAVVIADLDLDGWPDVVVCDQGANTSSGGVSVLFNDRTGSFGSPVQLAAGTTSVAVAVGNLFGGAFPAIAVANYGSGDVSLFRNQGNRSFTPAGAFPAGGGPAAISIADMNADLSADLVVANANANNVTVLLNQGGTFAAPAPFPAGSGPEAQVLTDLNGDGLPDVVIADTDGTLSVLAAQGGGAVPLPLPPAGSTPAVAVAVGDIDGDGRPDIIVANYGIQGGADGDVSVLLNQGGYSFGNAIHFPATKNPTSVALADLNGDGRLDVVVGFNAGPGGVDILFNTRSH